MTTATRTRWLSTKEASEYSGFSQHTIRELAKQWRATKGKRGLRGFQTVAPQGPWKFKHDDIDRYIEGRTR